MEEGHLVLWHGAATTSALVPRLPTLARARRGVPVEG